MTFQNAAVNALKENIEKIIVLSQEPEIIPPKENKRTPADIYNDDLAPIINKYPPFDWGGYGDPHYIKSIFESFLKKGLFDNSKPFMIFSGPKPPPYAELIIDAWRVENYETAFDIVNYEKEGPRDPYGRIPGGAYLSSGQSDPKTIERITGFFLTNLALTTLSLIVLVQSIWLSRGFLLL